MLLLPLRWLLRKLSDGRFALKSTDERLVRRLAMLGSTAEAVEEEEALPLQVTVWPSPGSDGVTVTIQYNSCDD